MPAPDFGRRIVCVLGLPFDAVDRQQAVTLLREAAKTNTRCWLSTPNLNFAVACAHDAQFRQSVLDSQLSVADGWPVLLAARLAGAPLPERVAGSDLFEVLKAGAGRALRVFFFGGPPGAAAAACERLSAAGGSMVCVGHDEAGFGGIEAMSADARIDAINASGAEFVVVALGARKGQAWIEHNRQRLSAPVLGHLGAVVNFVAGSVRRAPRWMQALHLEWLWRIREEPALWRRYAGDGAVLLWWLLSRLLPYALLNRRRAADDGRAAPRCHWSDATQAGRAALTISGAWTAADSAPLRQALARAATTPGPLRIDMSQVTHTDAAVTGLLVLLWGHRQSIGSPWSLVPPERRSVVRGWRWLGASYLCS